MTQTVIWNDGPKRAVRKPSLRRVKRKGPRHPFVKSITLMFEGMATVFAEPELTFKVNEEPDSWTLTTELPNVLRQDIRVLAFDGVLMINALRRPCATELLIDDTKDESADFGDPIIQRSIEIPIDATTDGACVLFQNETLTIILPKGPRSTEQLHRLNLVDH